MGGETGTVMHYKWECGTVCIYQNSNCACTLLVSIYPIYMDKGVLSHVWLFATPWTVAHQVPLFMQFSRQEYWSKLPFSTPEDLPAPGIELASPASPALAGEFFTTEPPGG